MVDELKVTSIQLARRVLALAGARRALVVLFGCLVLVATTIPATAQSLTLVDTTVTGVIDADSIRLSGRVIFTGAWLLDTCHITLDGAVDARFRVRVAGAPTSALTVTSAPTQDSVKQRFTVVAAAPEESIFLSHLDLHDLRSTSQIDTVDRANSQLDTFPIVTFDSFAVVEIVDLQAHDNRNEVSGPRILTRGAGTLGVFSGRRFRLGGGCATGNRARHRGGVLWAYFVDSVFISHFRAVGNIAADTFFRPDGFTKLSGGGGALLTFEAKLAVLDDVFVSHTESGLGAVTVEADSVYIRNMAVVASNSTVSVFDRGSGRPHILEHVTLTGEEGPISSANVVLRNSVVTSNLPNGRRIQPWFNLASGSPSKTVTYENTAINYRCDDCPGTIAVPPQPHVSPRPAPPGCPDSAAIAAAHTPMPGVGLGSEIIDRAPALPSVPFDLLGRPRPQGTAADLGAFERPDTSVSVADAAPARALALYPNPARDRVTVRLPAGFGDVSAIEVYRVDGARVLAVRGPVAHAGEYTLALGSDLASGAYWVVAHATDGTHLAAPLQLVR